MPFEDAVINAAPPTTRLVIVCLGSVKDRVRAAIGSLSRAGWDKNDNLKLIVLHDRFRETSPGIIARQARTPASEVLEHVNAAAPISEAARIIVIEHFPFPALPEGDIRTVLRVSTVSKFEEALPALLRQAGLDWMSQTIADLGHYHQAVIDATAVQRWLEQFDRIKETGHSKGWIGRALLKLLEVVPSGKVGEALLRPPHDFKARNVPLSVDWMQRYQKIVCWETSGARSSALVSRYVSKCLGEPMKQRIQNFSQIQSVDANDGPILFLEDCLMTGKECIERIKALRPFIEGSTQRQIDFKFAVTTAVGICRVRSFLHRQKISGVRVLDSDQPSIDNLTASGWKAASADALFDPQSTIVAPAENVINRFTLRAKGTFDDGQRNHILRFCRIAGEQLMRQYLPKIHVPPIDAVAIARKMPLGLDNLGLFLAFAHGVPDGTLPIFWISGEVEFGKEKFVWMPLFPSVE